MKEEAKNELISLLHLKKSGNRGWYLGNCCFCGKEDHLGVIFGTQLSSFKCQKCGEKGPIYGLLVKLNRIDLASKEKKSLNLDNLQIKDLFAKESIIDLTIELPNRLLPIGSKKIIEGDKYWKYLIDRGVSEKQIIKYQPHHTNLHPIYKQNYIIFPIYQFNEIKGFIARSLFTKNEIKEINLTRSKSDKYLRYRNSAGTDFEKIIYDFDNLITYKKIILEEGIFSKFNSENFTKGNYGVGVTFGKKISPFQIELLKQLPLLEELIILFDPDAISEVKEYSKTLPFKLKIGFIPFRNEEGEYKDPGDIDEEEFNSILENLEEPFEFNLNKVAKKILL